MNETVLELRGISKQFGEGDARVDALVDIDLRVDAGELVALIGPSGSGKSTLLSIAGALLSPTAGTATLDGLDISSVAEKERAVLRLQKIGFIFQGSNLVSYLTGREQLLFLGHLTGLPKDDTGQRADRLLDELGMTGRASHYVEMLANEVHERGKGGVLVTHDERLIDLCDRVVRIADGRLTTESLGMMAMAH